MTKIKCPECKQEVIIQKVQACPGCGYPIKDNKKYIILPLVVLLFAAVSFLAGFFIGQNTANGENVSHSQVENHKEEIPEVQKIDTSNTNQELGTEEVETEEISYVPTQLDGKYIYNYDDLNKYNLYFVFTSTSENEGTFISHFDGEDTTGKYSIKEEKLYLEYDSEYHSPQTYIFYKDYLINVGGFLTGVVGENDDTFNLSSQPFEFHDDGTVEINNNKFTYERKDDMIYIDAGANTYKLIIYEGSLNNSHLIKSE